MKQVKAELKNILIKGDHIMNCKKTYAYLFQWARDAIQPADKVNVEAHLDVCAHCNDIAQSLRKLAPQIKPAPEGMMRHYLIQFPHGDGEVISYFGITSHIPNHERLNATLKERGGVIPDNETWFQCGFGGGTNHLAEFDNEGNRVEVTITDKDNGYKSIKYKKMVKVFKYHEANSFSLSRDDYGSYVESPEAPNLYIVKNRNNFGQNLKSGIYSAIPGKAVNVRLKKGVDVIPCGAYQFVYDDRYVTEGQAVELEATYNL
jgi:hypothetical protein